MRHGQRGVALLLALMVAALAAVVAMQVIERSHSSVARTQAISDDLRAYQLALGMSALAQQWLRDADQSLPLDAWTVPMQVPGGSVQGRLLDWSGRFNLNALAHEDPQQAEQARLSFERLLVELSLDRSLAQTLADWLAGGGVGQYASAQPPYRHAGVKLADISELRWLQGMDADTYARLRAHVSALPEPILRVNVNATTVPVLAALVPALDQRQAAAVLARRPYRDIEALLSQDQLTATAQRDLLARVDLDSGWFMAEARVTLNGQAREYQTLLTRWGSGYPYRYFSQGAP